MNTLVARLGTLFAMVLGASLGHATGNASAKPQADFSAAPAEVRQFLLKAREANNLLDPMQRCLVYPDLPGHQWVAGAAKAQCEFALGKRITIDKIAEYVNANRVAELDAWFQADLERHFSKTDFSEAIHKDFDDIVGDYRSGKLTKIWLEKAPNSPYALTARATYYASMARNARGGEYASQTSSENFTRMSEFIVLAVDAYNNALRVEPRLIEAYDGLMGVATLDSRTELGSYAFSRAQELDPACRRISVGHMTGLKPRWGGSYAEMEAYAAQLRPFLPLRPLLANTIAEIAYDKASVQAEKRNYRQAIELLAPVVLQAPYYDVHDKYANYLFWNRAETPWQQIVHLIHADRFTRLEPRGARQLGYLLTEYDLDLDWAITVLQRAAEQDPEDGYGQNWLATALFKADRKTEAIKPLRALLDDDEYRKSARYNLALIYHDAGSFQEALQEIDLVMKEWTDATWLHIQRGEILKGMGRLKDAEAAYNQFLDKSKDDPTAASNQEYVRKTLMEIKQSSGEKK